jgi:vancomycin resistance protein YoaR
VANHARNRRTERTDEATEVDPLPPNRRVTPSDDDAGGRLGRARRRRIAIGAGALALFLVLLYVVDRARYSDRIARGAVISGVSVAGLTASEARDVVAREADSRLAEPLFIEVRGSRFEVSPAEIGASVDIDPVIAEAVAVGRSGGPGSDVLEWIGSIGSSRELSVPLSIDPSLLDPLFDAWQAEAIEDGPFLGAVVALGDAPTGEYPRPGWVIDRATALDRIEVALARLSGEGVEVPLVRQVPPVVADQVDRAVIEARALTAAPVVLEETPASFEARTAELQPTGDDKPPSPPNKKGQGGGDPPGAEADGPKPWRLELSRADLLGALRSRPVLEPQAGIELFFDARSFKKRLDEFSAELEEPAVDAKFVVDAAGRLTLTPSRPGTRVDADAMAAVVLSAARDPQRLGALPVERGAEPSFSSADAEGLRITKMVSQFTTRHACCQPRVTNIHLIADMLDGTIVRPGETFSVNALVGARTEDKGFVKAPSIEDGEMVDTPGGGISQFATTLFNAVLEGGYDIVERQPHSFYFHRYPVGHEATLSYPKPDLIFKNDTEAGMLIACDHDRTWIRVRIFGDTGGRKVDKQVSQPFDLTEPETEYEANDKLDPDDEEVIEEGTSGWAVTATRIVTFVDGTTKEESRKVTYKPRPRLVEVHSCRIPKKKKGYTGKPCPEPDPDEDGAEDPDADDASDEEGTVQGEEGTVMGNEGTDKPVTDEVYR